MDGNQSNNSLFSVQHGYSLNVVQVRWCQINMSAQLNFIKPDISIYQMNGKYYWSYIYETWHDY